VAGAQPVGEIVWIASYPKSGNTWLRALLTNYLSRSSVPADLNQLIGLSASSRRLFDDHSGVKSTDLFPEEIERLRPRVYECLARRSRCRHYLKIHDAFAAVSPGTSLVPASVTRCVLYLIRHPADIAVSYAHHRGCDLDRVIELMADEDHRLADGSLGVEAQVPQRLGSWHSHIASWTDSGLDVCVVRYEDLSADPEGALRRVLVALGEPCEARRLQRAVAFSSFQELSRQERERGFFERPSPERVFFRSGRVSTGRVLTARQRARILSLLVAAPSRLGYGEGRDGP